MPVLYLVEQGATVHKEGDNFLVVKEGVALQKVPAAKVEQVVVFGNVHLTIPVLHTLLLQGVDCVFCSSTGRFHGRLLSQESGFGLLRLAQLRAVTQEDGKLSVARAMVRGKLSNQRTLLLRYAREGVGGQEVRQAVQGLEELLRDLEHVRGAARLHGVEGQGSALYYQGFRAVLRQNLGFQRRQRRPPRDPVNSLLSFGYTLLAYAVQSAVRTVGLDPFLGFLHEVRSSRPSLALDLMEEFRPVIVDSVVLRVLNTRELTPQDFEEVPEEDGMVRLRPDGMRAFLARYEERVQGRVLYPPTGTQETYRRILELQARHLARVVLGKDGAYQPLLVR